MNNLSLPSLVWGGLLVLFGFGVLPKALHAQAEYVASRPLAAYAAQKITTTPRATLIVGEPYIVYQGGEKFCAVVSGTYGFVGYVPATLLKSEINLDELEEYDLEAELGLKAAEFVGRRVWTNWDVIYIDSEGGLFGSIVDEKVTRFKSGNVIYQSQRSAGSKKQISTTNSQEFVSQFNGFLDDEANERKGKSVEENIGASLVSGKKKLRLAERGSPLTFVDFRFKLNMVNQRVEVELHDPFDQDYEIWLYADDGYGLSAGVFESLLYGMFSFEDPNVAVEISLGMSIEEIIRLKGEPITRINLGTKTILTYSDVKFIFENGLLADAQ